VTAQLARRLGTGSAVMIGLGSMMGAGVFAALGPAARGVALRWWRVRPRPGVDAA
jgi:amino acid transporter